MDKALSRDVWRRAGAACEYCRLPHGVDPLPFQLDHINHPDNIELREALIDNGEFQPS